MMQKAVKKMEELNMATVRAANPTYTIKNVSVKVKGDQTGEEFTIVKMKDKGLNDTFCGGNRRMDGFWKCKEKPAGFSGNSNVREGIKK